MRFIIPFNGGIDGVGGGKRFYGGNGVAEEYEPKTPNEARILASIPSVRIKHETIRKPENTLPPALAQKEASAPAAEQVAVAEATDREAIRAKLMGRNWNELKKEASMRGLLRRNMKKAAVVGVLMSHAVGSDEGG